MLKKNLLKIQSADISATFFRSSLTPLSETLLMAIFIQQYSTSVVEKTLLSFFLSSGLLFCIPLTIFVSKINITIRNFLIKITLITFVLIFIFLGVQQFWFYYLLAIAIGILINIVHTLQSAIYSKYPKNKQGKKVSYTLISFVLGSIVFSKIFDFFISSEQININIIFIIILCCLFICIICYTQFPKTKIESMISFKAIFRCLKNDKIFLYMSMTWFIMGFANLALLPYRTNLLMEEKFGFSYSPEKVLFLLVVLPEGIRVFSFIFSGKFFDKYKFISFRIVVNLLLSIYVLLFFFGNSWFFHVLGMVVYGLAHAGGSIAWKLWINKLVSRDKVPLYMSVHTTLTGIRVAIASLVGLYAMYSIGPKISGLICFFLITLSSILFFRIGKKKNF